MPSTPVFLSHPSSRDHDTGDHPERIRRIEAIDELLARRDWLGYEQVSSPAVERRVLELVHPRSTWTGSPPHPVRVALNWIRTRSSAPAPTRPPCMPPGAPSSSCGGLSTAVRARSDSVPHRPPGHHAVAARAMGFCLFNNIAVAARYALDELGLERRSDPRLGRSSRQRHQRHLLGEQRGPVRLDPSVARCIPGAEAHRSSAATRAAGTRSTCRCHRDRATKPSSRWCAMSRCRSPAATARSWCSSPRATTPMPAIRWPIAGHRRWLRGDGRAAA